MTSRSKKIKNIFRDLLASELIISADDQNKVLPQNDDEEVIDEDVEEDVEEDFDEEGFDGNKFTEQLFKYVQVEEPEKEPEKGLKDPEPKQKEKNKFIPPEVMEEALTGIKVQKKEPIMPHRVVDQPLRIDMPQEMETSSFTKGEVVGKVCDLCGRFNFPGWKTECSYCKKVYNILTDLVDFKGLTTFEAFKAVSSGRQFKENKEEDFAGMITSPGRMITNKRYYLTIDELKEIWMKKGIIKLPDKPEDLSLRFEDKRGLVGIPKRLKLDYALETQLNVQRVEKEIFDPKTQKKIKVKDVYYDPNGIPVPIPYKDRNYFSLYDISKKMEMSPDAVVKEIHDYNNEHGLSGDKQIRPVRYYDDLNQVFNWKAIEPIFRSRIVEVYENSKKTYLNKIQQRVELLNKKLEELELTKQTFVYTKETLQRQIKDYKFKAELAQLFKFRVQSAEIIKKVNTSKNDEEKRVLIQELENINKSKEALEKKYGYMLDKVKEQMTAATENLSRIDKKIERMKKSKASLIENFKDFINAVGKPGEVPEELKPSSLQKAKTGKEATIGEAINIEEFMKGEKKAGKINSFLKLADEEQLDFGFGKPQKKELGSSLEELLRGLLPKQRENIEEQIRKIRLTKLTKEEAEDRLDAEGGPLSSGKIKTIEQRKERKKEIQRLIDNEKPSLEEAISRYEATHEKPVLPAPEFKAPKKEMEKSFSDKECPFCKKKKITKGSDKCSECGFVSAPNRKDIIVEQIIFRTLFDKNGNSIPKLDENGEPVINSRGEVVTKKRPEKIYSMVSVQYDELGNPEWATARKASHITPDLGAKTLSERLEVYKKVDREPPRIREIKPLSKTKDDYVPVFKFERDDNNELQKVDTGVKTHKDKAKNGPEPDQKIKPENFENYPVIHEAIKFINNEQLSDRIRVWTYKDTYQPKKIEVDKKKDTNPTILPTE